MHRHALALAFAIAPMPATAASDSMTITATVLSACRVAAGEMAFGTLGAQPAAAAARADVLLDCTPGTAFSVAMDEGRNGARRMANNGGTQFLSYDIFRDAAARQRWGAGASAEVAGVAPEDGRVELAAYGRITALEAATGTYSDLVTVVASF